MPDILEGAFGWFNLSPCKNYGTNEALFEGLRRLDNNAIQCALLKCNATVKRLVKQLGLSADLSEDVLSEALTIFIAKIQDKTYQFEGNAPTTFLIEIARRVAQNYTRTLKGRRMDSLEERHNELHDDGVEDYFEKKDSMEMIERLLAQLGRPCSDIIQLKYLEGYKDDEVIAKKLTSYTSVESLKVSRGQCMKKLRLMAHKAINKIGLL